MKRSFIESFERELLKEQTGVNSLTNYHIWFKNSNKFFYKSLIDKEFALREIVNITRSLTAEQKKNLELEWVDGIYEEIIVSVCAQKDGMSIDDRIVNNWEYEYAANLIKNALEESELIENSSSYLIQVESNGKVVKEQENKGISQEDALEEILDFISELTSEEKQNVGLAWNLDWEKIGDSGGDVVVSVYGPSERDEWPEEDRADTNEWTLAEWEFAEKQIRRALGLPRK